MFPGFSIWAVRRCLRGPCNHFRGRKTLSSWAGVSPLMEESENESGPCATFVSKTFEPWDVIPVGCFLGMIPGVSNLGREMLSPWAAIGYSFPWATLLARDGTSSYLCCNQNLGFSFSSGFACAARNGGVPESPGCERGNYRRAYKGGQ